ncbi:hypothetical protein OKW33_006840 [Paraburkholderia atlantica]
MQPVREFQHGLLEHALQRIGDIEVALPERTAAFARRTEALGQTRRIDGIAAVPAVLDDLAKHIDIGRLAVRRKRHHLVLVRRVQEAEPVGHRFVQQAERVRQLDLFQARVLAADELPHAGRHAFAAAVHRQHGGVVERRREKRARLVREMVLDEVPCEAVLAIHALEALAQMMRRAVEQLALRVRDIAEKQRVPRRRGRIVRTRAGRIERQLDRRARLRRHAAEQRGVVRVSDVIDVGERDAGGFQAVVDRVERQLPGRERHRTFRVLDVREAFVFGGGEHHAVTQQRGRAVVIDRIDSECVHGVGNESGFRGWRADPSATACSCHRRGPRAQLHHDAAHARVRAAIRVPR